MAAASTFSCGEAVVDSTESDSPRMATYSAPLESQSTSPGTYRHPLQANVPGLTGTPLLDVRDDPNTGGRFVIGDEIRVREDGTVYQFSGVKTMYRDGGNEAPSPFSKTGTPSPRRIAAAPVISPDLRTRMSQLEPGERIEVNIAVRHSAHYEPIIYGLERAIADGRIQTVHDRVSERQQLGSRDCRVSG